MILVTVDTLRADHVGLYGYERDTTPRSDEFFSRGTVFERAISPAPCTLPAVSQVLSGRHEPGPERPTLAERLRAHGYRTHAVASQHLFQVAGQRRPRVRWLAAQLARGFEGFDLQPPPQVDRHGLSVRTADEVTDRALDWLDAQPDGGPFFLWLHYFDPHDPYEPPARFRLFGDGRRSSPSGDRRQALLAGRRTPDEPWQRAGHVFGEHDVEHLVALYDAEIRWTDHQLGRLFDALEARDLVRRSIVVLLSDHGEWLGEEGRWDHCQTLHGVELNVPFLIRVRGAPLGGRSRVAGRVTTLDLAPTVLGLAGVAGFSGDGVDLRGALPERLTFAFWEDLAAAYAGPWKLVAAADRVRLYQVEADPAERRDRSHDARDVRLELEGELRAFAAGQQEARDQTRELAQQLRSLAYLE